MRVFTHMLKPALGPTFLARLKHALILGKTSLPR
jgi:hypothetical protein